MNIRKWAVVSHGIEGTNPVDVRIESLHFTREGAARVLTPSAPWRDRYERVMRVDECVGVWKL